VISNNQYTLVPTRWIFIEFSNSQFCTFAMAEHSVGPAT